MCMCMVYNFYKHDYKNALVFNLNDGYSLHREVKLKIYNNF